MSGSTDQELTRPTAVAAARDAATAGTDNMKEQGGGNRRQRIALTVILVIALLALVGLAVAVFRLTPGVAPPSQKSLPFGINWVRSIYGWGMSRTQALEQPSDTDIGPDGTIWVVSGHDTIAGFNPDGTPKRIIRPEGVASLEGISVADNGDIYVTDFGGQVLQYSPTGQQLDQWKVELPNEIDVRDGKIAVACAAGIAVFTPEGKILTKLGTRGSGDDQFDLPHGILLGDDGTIFVSDTQNRRVRAFSESGRLLWSTGITPNRKDPSSGDFRNPEAMKGPFALPAGMTFDGKGQVCVVDPFKFTITVLDQKTGKIVKVRGKSGSLRTASFGDFGQSDGLFGYPTGISYDPARDWFAVADTANNRVQVLRLPGSGGAITARLVGAYRPPMLVFLIPLLPLLLLVPMARRRHRERTAELALREAG